jgi:propionyl-CoA synthetase
MSNYETVHRQSIENPEEFWGRAAKGIVWDHPYDRVLDETRAPFYRWFAGGRLNTCYNALDRHVDEGRGAAVALIYDSPVTGTVASFTYRDLRNRVARFAGALRSLGLERGDTAIIYMPMIPETVIAMLACARLGAVHSVVFGGFAPPELAVRIDHARPKLLLTASGAFEGAKTLAYKPLVDSALDLATHKPDHCVVFQRPGIVADLVVPRDVDWNTALEVASDAECVPVEATDPLYILYTSGTTGQPKGVVRDNGGHAVALRWSMENVYDVRQGDVFWAASDVGWVVGHSYIVYAPLFAGCTTVLYEGKPVGTPDPGAFWRVISQHGVRVLFTAPTAIRAIKKEDPRGELARKYDLDEFKYLFLAGERLDPDTLHWARALLDRPVIDHWWQTESGWPMAANCLGIEALPVKPGSPTVPVPGYDITIVDVSGRECGPNEEGAVVVRLPLPPGTLPTLWNDDERFVSSYLSRYPGYYLTADGGYRDEDGYLFVMGRTDDVINVAGHRLSTGAMEEVIATHPDVAECAVIGAGDAMKGQVPLGFIVLKSGVDREADSIRLEIASLMREKIGPIACYRDTTIVDRLPKTRSGKILRGTMRHIADGSEYRIPSTIDDPGVLASIAKSLQGLGYPRKTS